MKSVLHIGLESDMYSHLGLKKGFLAAGFTEYNFFNWQAVRMNAGVQGCQARMIVAATNLKPDLIFMHLQNPDILDDETVTELSKIAFTVNFSFDVRDADGTEWMYQLAPYFGLTLFACKEDADEARRRGIHNVGNIHSSCDTDVYHPIEMSCDCSCHKDHGPGNYTAHIVPCCEGGILRGEQRRRHLQAKHGYPDIVLIANNYERTNHQFEKSKEREEMVNFMKAEFGDRFGVFGMNWGAESRIINPQEENIIYNSAKIAVCHNNFHRVEYCSDRQWRAISCGALTVINDYEHIQKDFEGECPKWTWFDQLAKECRFYLENEGPRRLMAFSQRQQFIHLHTWEHRIETIKEMIYGITSKQSAAV
jgi:hypothetical protein